MVKEKVYSSFEQKIIGKSSGGYISYGSGNIKCFIRCGGKDYRDNARKLYFKIRQFLKNEGYLFDGPFHRRVAELNKHGKNKID